MTAANNWKALAAHLAREHNEATDETKWPRGRAKTRLWGVDRGAKIRTLEETQRAMKEIEQS